MIPLFKVLKPQDIGKIIEEVYDSGIITEGMYADKFEERFSEMVGNPGNVALTNSGTSALTLAAHCCDIQKGDVVISTAMTCMATNIPFHNAGAYIHFADVEAWTGNIDAESVESIVKDYVGKGIKPKAIVVVHWAGQPVNLDAISQISKKYGIPVIEDAAHALGSTYGGKAIGTHSDFVCFSFQAIKHLSTVDGGAISCRDKETADRIRKLRWFGLNRHFKSPPGVPPASRWEQDITEVGYKMHMNNVNAAIGLRQLETIDAVLSLHAINGKAYDELIDTNDVYKLKRIQKAESTYWIYSVLVEDRNHFKKYMEQNGIATDVVHVRNDRYSVFENYRRDPGELRGLDFFESRLINIPVGWWLNADTPSESGNVDMSKVNYIIDKVNAYENQ